MSNNVLNELGELVIRNVRDKGIDSWNDFVQKKKLPIYLEQYQTALDTLTPEQQELLAEAGTETIDGIIHDLLLILDDEWVTIKLVDKAGTEYDLKELATGSLQGYIFI